MITCAKARNSWQSNLRHKANHTHRECRRATPTRQLCQHQNHHHHHQGQRAKLGALQFPLDEEFYSGLNLSDQDRLRLAKEFYYPPHIAFVGNYYPRYKTRGDSHTGTSHVSYLSRPYYSYLVPNRYSGYSKYVYITKIN